MGSGMFLHEGMLFYTNTAGEMKAANADNGSISWIYKTKGKIYSTPIVYKDIVWCASTDSYLYGLDAQTGKERFKLKNDKAVVSSAACAADKVMLAGGDGHCRAWNVTTGKLVWDFDSVNNFVVTRPLVKDGVLFLVAGVTNFMRSMLKQANLVGSGTMDKQTV